MSHLMRIQVFIFFLLTSNFWMAVCHGFHKNIKQ